jgi:hypothetical protein
VIVQEKEEGQKRPQNINSFKAVNGQQKRQMSKRIVNDITVRLQPQGLDLHEAIDHCGQL